MKRNWFLHLMLLGMSLFCLMGLTNSYQPNLSVTIPVGVFEPPAGIAKWDWVTNNTEMLGDVRIRNWSEMAEMAGRSAGEKVNYVIYLDEFETLLRNNIFLFTRIGIYDDNVPSFRHMNFKAGHNRYLYQPDAFTLAKILTDSNQDATREAFVSAAIRAIKDPKTKQAWEKQRQEFCRNMPGSSRGDMRGWGWSDYNRAQSIDYETSISLAFNEVLRLMRATDFSLKVVPTRYHWIIVRVINNFFEAVDDRSPFMLQSACYRMGPEATQKLIGYVERGLESLED